MRQTIQLFNLPTILIVEDDIQLADIFSKALNHEGYKTVVVNSGNEVNSALKITKVNLILLDIMLPGKDGFQVLKELKDTPSTRKIPVIMLTSMGEVELIEKSLRSGAADYIIKHNVDFHKINNLLQKHLISMDARKNMHME